MSFMDKQHNFDGEYDFHHEGEEMIQEVVEILDPQIKTGVGQKGEWSQAKVKLKNGEIAYIFQPIEVGDMVEAFQNGQYTNWKIVKEPAKRGFSSSPPNPKITTTTGFTQADRDLLVEIHAQIIGPGAYDD